MIEAFTAARTFVDSFQATGIIERNKPGIMFDRGPFVDVGQPIDADGMTMLVSIDSDYSSKPPPSRWKLMFERKSGERFSVISPNSQSAQQLAR